MARHHTMPRWPVASHRLAPPLASKFRQSRSGRVLEHVSLALGLRSRARHGAGRLNRRRHHRVALSVRRRPGGRRRSAIGMVARVMRAGSDRSRKVHRSLPIVARQWIDLARLRRSAFTRNHFGGRPRRPRGRMAGWLWLHHAGDVGRRQPRRHGRGAVRRAASGPLRQADHHIRGAAAGWLGHGDAAPATRAGPRRPSQWRCHHRHDARASARMLTYRGRESSTAVWQAAAASRSASGRRISRSPRRRFADAFRSRRSCC